MPTRILIPLIVACGLFMEQLDATVISTSLPAIAKSLAIDPISLKLAMTSYLLSLAVFVPISGWAADKYGARTVFMAAIIIFTAASALCGIANTLVEFVIYRFLQGVGGAMMVPVGRLVILRTVPKSEMISALAWLTIPALFGPVVGPIFGGFITTYFHWRWIFYINVPVGLLGLFLSWRYIANVKEMGTPPLDRVGFLLSGLGLSALVFGLAMLGEELSSPTIGIALILVGIVVCAIYVRYSRTVAHPVIDLKLMQIQTFRVSVIGGSLMRVGLGALPFLLPLMLQLGFGMTAFQSGMLTFAAAAGAILMKTSAAWILRHYGFRMVLIVNSALSTFFLAATGFFSAQTSHAVIIVVLLLGGFFRSLIFTAVNAIGYADIKASDMSHATSFSSVAQQIAFSMGVTLGALVLEGQMLAYGTRVPTVHDFSVAFWVVSIVSGASVISFWMLSPNAGHEFAEDIDKAPKGPLDAEKKIATQKKLAAE